MFRELISECRLFRRHAPSESEDAVVATLMNRLEAMLMIVEEGLQYLDDSSYVTEYCMLRGMRRELTQHIRLILHGVNDCTVPPIALFPVSTQSSRSRGRPRVIVNVDLVELLRSCGYTWTEIADAVQVSRATIWRRLNEAGVSLNKYTDISDDELDGIVGQLQKEYPNCGQQMIQGFLKDRGVCVQRRRLRDSVQRTDPLRRHVRWHEVLRRRTYSVKQSNSLWHIDGHHSLIRWRMVIHGGIDGYSRMIVYLSCSSNNKALTVYHLFKEATEEYGVPSRVRSDRGGENMLVCQFMVSYRGTGRGSHIAGSSVHNQRIERLWRDVYRCVCSTFYETFYVMESMGILDPENDGDLFVLQCVYLPRIRKSVEEFRRAWNLHPVRTERNWTPRQIMMNSLIKEDEIAASSDPPPSDYGIDPLGPVPDEEFGSVEVPETISGLDEEKLERFMSCVDTETAFDDMGIEHYSSCKQLFQSLCLQ